MIFWFNKQYSNQRNDYNIVARLIIILGSRLPDSHSPASALARSRFSTHTARLLHSFSPASQLTLISLSFPALSRTCPENARGQGHAGLFHETIHLKGPTTHWCTRRRRGSHDIVYGSADILGLLPTILYASLATLLSLEDLVIPNSLSLLTSLADFFTNVCNVKF